MRTNTNHKDTVENLADIDIKSLENFHVHQEHKCKGITVQGGKIDTDHLLGIEKFGKAMQDSFQFADDLSRIFAINLSIKINLFETINLGKTTIIELIEKLNFKGSERHLMDLLDQLYILGLLDREESTVTPTSYTLTDYSKNFLLKSSPNNNSYVFLNLDRYIKKYQNLHLTFSSGKTVYFCDDFANEDEIKCYVDYFTKTNEHNFNYLIDEIKFEKYETIVDIHGLNGSLATKIKAKFPNCVLTSFENKTFKQIAGPNVKSSIVNVVYGDIRKQVPESDCVIAPHILMHFNLENKQIVLKRIFDALKLNGCLIILENLIDDKRTKDSCAMKISFMLTIMGYEGHSCSFKEYKYLLVKAGFEDVHLMNQLNKPAGVSDIIIARKLTS